MHWLGADKEAQITGGRPHIRVFSEYKSDYILVLRLLLFEEGRFQRDDTIEQSCRTEKSRVAGPRSDGLDQHRAAVGEHHSPYDESTVRG